KLYRDDIEAIIDSMKEISADGEIRMEIAGYQCLDLDQALQIPNDSLRTMSLSFRNPQHSSHYCTFDVMERNSTLRCEKDTLLYRGAYHKIEEIVRPRRRWWVSPNTATGILMGTIALVLT